MAWSGLIHQYREFLPVSETTPIVTLNEGNTPLIRADRLGRHLGLPCEVYLKYEGANPTGSFKDRGMTLAMSKAVERGAQAVICASTGNTSASTAASAARAGLKAFVLIPEGKIALGKLSQAMFHGASVLQIRGNFDDALKIVREISQKHPIILVNSLNPDRLEGQKTAAFEACDQLGDAPTCLFIPVGNAGNITAYWRGFREYRRAGKVSRLPRMIGWQAEGAAPIVRGPQGSIDMLSDEEILDAYGLLSQLEGVFCEAASAASIAGMVKWIKTQSVSPSERVVCVLTGHGLKDPDTAVKRSPHPARGAAGGGTRLQGVGGS